MIGVIDRFEDNNKVVILIEEINEELIVDKSTLPQGSEIDTYLNLKKQANGEITVISIDKKATKKAAQTTSNLMAKLKAKSTQSKFKK
ncbi:DUF3006 domain-containing protein [Ornithinibacillus salinisoli]|uniref:DUF3006 domain-containing protein n=1 Tax=Ornithinibacillus salinisoli TaxID=1848459 RepID=A0ABW4W3A4_9BACI